MENYKEKYDNLVDVLKTTRNDEGKSGYTFKSVIDSILPELRESEDEKIRKDIIEHFQYEIEELSKYISWLEKKKTTEWRKEDAENLSQIILLLDQLNHMKGFKGIKISNNIPSLINWLKSLKPQPHWKPILTLEGGEE